LHDSKVISASLQKPASQTIGESIRTCLFFILACFYLYLSVDLSLIYYNCGKILNYPVFFKGWSFFCETIFYPGGLASYLAALLAQSFSVSWLAAIIATLQLWLIYLCVNNILKTVKAASLVWISYIPPILLLILYTQYAPYFFPTMALLTALAFVCLYLKIEQKNKMSRLILFLLLSVTLYFLGGKSFPLFAAFCGIYELFFKRSWRTAILYLFSIVVIPYILGVFVLDISPVDIFNESLPYHGQATRPKNQLIIIYALYLLLPFCVFVFGLKNIFRNDSQSTVYDTNTHKKTVRKSPRQKIMLFSWYFQNNNLKWIFNSLLLFIITGIALFYYHDSQQKMQFKVDYYAYHRMWHKIPQVASDSKELLIIHMIDRGLYHTGRLPYDMFSYPQRFDVLMLSTKQLQLLHWHKFDFFLDIGLIDIAEHNLTELMEGWGRRPEILKSQALINMVKGNIPAAKIYLGKLRQSFFYNDWAQKYLDEINLDPNLSTDPEVGRLRSLMIKKDKNLIFTIPVDQLLLGLLDENKHNKMAFEYLMAFYMLTGQLDKFAQNIHRLNDFDYPNIPHLYEEAILLYNNSIKREPITLDRYQISLQSMERFAKVQKIFDRHMRDKAWVRNELIEKYGDSYLFYFVYRQSGLKK